MKTTVAAAAILIASTVAGAAADLPMKARPYIAPEPIWSWTGFYIGAHVGAGWGTTESTITDITQTSIVRLLNNAVPASLGPLSIPFSQDSRSGFLGGGQVGINWQSGWFVLGAQADIAGMDIKGTTPCAGSFGMGSAGGLSCSTRSDWLATVTGRVGAVVAEHGLLYVKGGGAWLNSRSSVNLPNLGPIIGGGVINGQELTSREYNQFGWLLGFGVEYMFARNWSAFIEYDYMDFDRKNLAFAINPILGNNTTATFNADITNRLSIAKVGVNYKFDWGAPLVARY